MRQKGFPLHFIQCCFILYPVLVCSFYTKNISILVRWKNKCVLRKRKRERNAFMGKVRLAASNIGWKKEDDERIYAKMQALGYAGLEIAPTRIFPDETYAHTTGATLFAGYLYQTYGLKIASMQSILNGQTENLFDAQGAKVLSEHLAQAYQFAASCKCSNLVFGSYRNRQMPCEDAMPQADRFFNENALLAAQYGCTLALEPVAASYGTNFLNTTLDTCRYVKQMGVPGLAVNLDVGNMLTNGEKMADLIEYLPLVNHVHISEPDMAPIQPHGIHRELALLLNGLGYQGYVSVEMKTTDADTVEKALEYVAEVFA